MRITQWQTCQCCHGLFILDGRDRCVSRASYGSLWYVRGVMTDLLMKEFISSDSYCRKLRLSQDIAADLLTLETSHQGGWLHYLIWNQSYAALEFNIGCIWTGQRDTLLLLNHIDIKKPLVIAVYPALFNNTVVFKWWQLQLYCSLLCQICQEKAEQLYYPPDRSTVRNTVKKICQDLYC